MILVVVLVIIGALVVLAVVDVVQTKHPVRRNYPLIGRLRYMLEEIGPELRQYIVTGNDEERPFSRDQRRWVYASSNNENQYFGFGTDSKMDEPQYLIIRHAAFPFSPPSDANSPAVGDENYLPCAKILGEFRGRRKAFRPQSVVNISAMSFGALSGVAVEALNRGARLAGCLHNTGEGGVSRHHQHGGDLIFQLGTGYFGARNPDGTFCLDKAAALVASTPAVKAIEIKLSQGAKPGLGGRLPSAKVTEEIAEARGVPVGVTVVSPPSHTAFNSVTTMIDFVEDLAVVTGLPVGIKSAVGDRHFWHELAHEMASTGRGPDFITIDGGEGGTGAAPLAFTDHVSLPYRMGMSEVFSTFARHGIHDRVVWIGAGRLGFPAESLLAMALGADMIYVAREAMMAVGCIQAQKCHTGRCPTGVTTHSKWLTRGLDPTDKAVRAGNYIMSLRHEMLMLSHACGKPHPTLVGGEAIDLLLEGETSVSLWDHFRYDKAWWEPTNRRAESLIDTMYQPGTPSA
ncbi:MAG: FMN-binding glutamate synthase family protein [Acidimicrobiia bacterium]|nr:FMN-binding glutamate synthase family protein [Acidimicrobiia bacterium]